MNRIARRSALSARVCACALVAASVTAACSSLPPFPTARTFGLGGDDTADILAAAPTANVSLADAIRAAADARGGDAIRAALTASEEGGARAVMYRVWVLAQGGAFDVSVDAQSGRVLYLRTGDADDTREISALRGAAGPDRRPLEEIVTLAAKTAPGATPWAAAYLTAETPRSAQVALVRDGAPITVTLDARTGVVR